MPPAPPLQPPSALRCEGFENPLGIDEAQPRFAWQMASAEADSQQGAWQIQVVESGGHWENPLWDSGKTKARRSFDLAYAGAALQARHGYQWRVRVWSTRGSASPWSETAWFETGLLGTKWRAKWIGLRRGATNDAPPAVWLKRPFDILTLPSQGRIYFAALGLFEGYLNGQRIGEDLLTPGWTDYRNRLDYLAYDVTALLRPGANTLEVVLGDGWWSGILSEPQFGLRYGHDPALLAQLVLTDAQGRETFIGTDARWQATADGPIRENALYHGETFDARREPRGWRAAELFPAPKITIRAKPFPPIRRMEERAPLAITEPRPGVFICDLGENVVGWARLRVTAKAGTAVQLRFGEMLESDGTLYTANLRSARATDRYLCRGGGEETWEPRFTFHGFRYLEVTGLPTKPESRTITGVIVHSDLADTGRFECSDPLVNQLQRCIVRGQKGNFVDIPTDCPQRDERLGWSGDAQVFAATACYHMASGPLFRSWMRSMCDGQRADGAFPDLAPHIILEHGNAGWGDAGVIVPWTVWRWSGDTRILEENYEAMERSLEFQRTTSRGLIRPDTLFGDWLAVDAAQPQHSPTPKDLIGTAYFAYTARLMAEIATALGRPKDAARYVSLSREITAAFQREFVTPKGRVLGDTQTGYLLALGFDLLPAKLRPIAIERLVELIRSRDWHLTTGFLGTPLLCPVLTACGRTDVAYRLLKQETYPSWLYPLRNGATTMWERWNSYTVERGFGDVGMNSFNHYAYGAVGEWLFGTVAGITPTAPGFQRIRIAPEPGGGLTWARAEVQTSLGPVRTNWKLTGRRFELHVEIPPNAEAEVRLPNSPGKPLRVGSGKHRFRATIPRVPA